MEQPRPPGVYICEVSSTGLLVKVVFEQRLLRCPHTIIEIPSVSQTFFGPPPQSLRGGVPGMLCVQSLALRVKFVVSGFVILY